MGGGTSYSGTAFRMPGSTKWNYRAYRTDKDGYTRSKKISAKEFKAMKKRSK